MPKREIRSAAAEVYNIYSDDGLQSVLCIVSNDGRYEVVYGKTGGSITGKASLLSEAHDRCARLAERQFRYANVANQLARVEREIAKLHALLV